MINLVDKGKNNIAFLCYLLLGQVEKCIDLLCATDRIPEAALLARTYMPSEVSRVIRLWRESLKKSGKAKSGEALADPAVHEALFPDIKYALVAEELFKRRRQKGGVPASEYVQWKDSLDWDIVGELKTRFPDGIPADAISQKPKEEDRTSVLADDEVMESMSHMSLDVNTTGTGSIRDENDLVGDVDVDVDTWGN